MTTLPTTTAILNEALAALERASSELSDARDWLKSDFRNPEGWSTAQVADRKRIMLAVQDAKTAIERALHRVDRLADWPDPDARPTY